MKYMKGDNAKRGIDKISKIKLNIDYYGKKSCHIAYESAMK